MVAFSAKVPQTVDRNLLFTIGLALYSCPTCVNGSRASASINNVSFVMPTIALLQAHFNKIGGVFTKDFPDNPPTPFNYTGTLPKDLFTSRGTRLTSLTYNSTVELVLGDASILTVDIIQFTSMVSIFSLLGQGLVIVTPRKLQLNSLLDPRRA